MYLQYPMESMNILYKKGVNSGLYAQRPPCREAVVVLGAYRESVTDH
jgi:hypothetical protein